MLIRPSDDATACEARRNAVWFATRLAGKSVAATLRSLPWNEGVNPDALVQAVRERRESDPLYRAMLDKAEREIRTQLGVWDADAGP